MRLSVTKCRHGSMLFFQRDEFIGRALEYYGEYSEIEAQLLSRLLSPGDTVVEAGANVGALTLAMARAVGEDGAIYAYEPQRVIFTALCANVAINGLWCVRASNMALASRACEMGIQRVDYSKPGNYGDVRLTKASSRERVKAIGIDALDLPSCRLIKIDVQGMEEDVLDGARDTIEKFKPYLYVENDAGTSHLPRKALMLGYRVFSHMPPLFNPDNFLHRSDNLWPGVVSLNLLCVPNGRQVSLADAHLEPWDFDAR